MKQPHILVFDSGAGGLSVTRHIIQKIPTAQITYVADNLNFPYGMIPADELELTILNALEPNIKKHDPTIAVIACNTASTLILPHLREKFAIPFVGVVPAIKPAALLSKTRCIGMLATSETVEREYTKQLINEFAKDTCVILHPTPSLVTAAEQYIQTDKDPSKVILKTVAALKQHTHFETMDTLVLACTHFPILKNWIQIELPKVRLIDSGGAIANRVFDLLNDTNKQNSPQKQLTKKRINIELTQPSETLKASYLRYLTK